MLVTESLVYLYEINIFKLQKRTVMNIGLPIGRMCRIMLLPIYLAKIEFATIFQAN